MAADDAPESTALALFVATSGAISDITGVVTLEIRNGEAEAGRDHECRSS